MVRAEKAKPSTCVSSHVTLTGHRTDQQGCACSLSLCSLLAHLLSAALRLSSSVGRLSMSLTASDVPDVDMVDDERPDADGDSEEEESSEDDHVTPENTCPGCDQEYGKQDAATRLCDSSRKCHGNC